MYNRNRFFSGQTVMFRFDLQSTRTRTTSICRRRRRSWSHRVTWRNSGTTRSANTPTSSRSWLCPSRDGTASVHSLIMFLPYIASSIYIIHCNTFRCRTWTSWWRMWSSFPSSFFSPTTTTRRYRATTPARRPSSTCYEAQVNKRSFKRIITSKVVLSGSRIWVLFP